MVESSPYDVILHPFVTEKTMGSMERENKLEFVVRRTATKPAIKKALEELFQVEVAQVNTKIGTDGQKHAVVRFAEGVKAEDIGTRVGIF